MIDIILLLHCRVIILLDYILLYYIILMMFIITIVWVVPPPSKSHHQDYYIFSRESQPKPSFATGILGGGTTQGIGMIFHSLRRSHLPPVTSHSKKTRFDLLPLAGTGTIQRAPFSCLSLETWFHRSPFRKGTPYTPETNIFAPENGWLEY